MHLYRRSRTLIALGVVIVGTTSLARAAEPAEPIRVELSSQPSCGSESQLLRAVLLRTARARPAEPGEAARTLHVEITGNDANGKLVGELFISEPGAAAESSEKRSISSESCRELLDALALFGALAVDPQASTEPLPEHTPEPEPARPPGPPPAPTPAVTPVRRFGASFGVEGGALDADTKALLPLAEPYLAFAWSRQVKPGFAVSPLARLAFSTSSGDTGDTPDGPAHLRWTTLRLGGCPIELGLLRSLGLRPCLELSAGALAAQGKTIAHPEGHSLAWVALGPALRLEWRPHPLVEVALSAGADL
ncbi:MAG TPA: hypothetical protein VNG33_04725, partial [Polyangiaceae bacterium]|nr:hypothetical protein [Polyangiaceae bacterium]